MTRNAVHRFWMIALAAGGVFAGHAIAFATPAAHAHADGTAHLHDAVHGYLPLLAPVVIPLAALALIALAIGEATTGRPHIDLAELLVLQASLFIAQESIERLIAGGSPLDVFVDPALWIGLAAQVFVAGATLLSVRGLARAAKQPSWLHPAVGRVFRAAQVRVVELRRAPASLATVASISRRGPPHLS
jgi:hypothetical protein